MRMASRGSIVLAVAVLVAATPASAQSPAPARPATTLSELASLVSPGVTLVVTDIHGRTVTGKLTALSPESLSLAAERHVETYTPGDISQIRHRVPDSKLNGAFYGLAAGFGGPAIACAASAAETDEFDLCMGVAVIVGAPAGFFIGMAVDAMLTKKVTVFEAPGSASGRVHIAPILGPGRLGVGASVRLGGPGRSAPVN